MRLTITSVDYCPADLSEQVPINVELLRQLPGPDRLDYWLGRLDKPLRWIRNNEQSFVYHLILAARWQGTRIEQGARNIPIGIAYVTDASQLMDSSFAFEKVAYVAIGMATEVGGGASAVPPKTIQAGRIGPAFGRGGKR